MTTVSSPAAPTLSVRGLSVEFPTRHGTLAVSYTHLTLPTTPYV